MSVTEVVISGIGGSFPHSSSMQAFGRDLLDYKYLPTPTGRWQYDSKLGVDAVCGQVPFEQSDDMFFGVAKKLANTTDPATKRGFMRSFEAIVDAGIHPREVRGASVGVYGGFGISEFEQLAIFNQRHDGWTAVGYARAMLANRVSYFFDFTGPSYSTDDSWTACHLGLSMAASDIRSGVCSAAVVLASHISRHPETSALLRQLGLVSDDGVTRSFDKSANGSIRSDCTVAFFLQRGEHAKRCYAKVLASGSAYVGRGSHVDMTLPSPLGIQNFLSNLYRANSIDPKRLAYVEADGSAHPLRDECELAAIDAALVQDVGRSAALPVGSVKGNLGHADCANGHAAICKVICALETGLIPATLNHRDSNEEIGGLAAGRLRVVTATTPLELRPDSVVAVNTLGLACSVGHTVLQANPRAPEPHQDPRQHVPRLVTLSAMTEELAAEVAKGIRAAPFDTNYYRLVQDAFSPSIRGYNYRSYIICPPTKEDIRLPVAVGEQRSVCFVYSGIGSQWPGMATDLMRIPIFGETIERLHRFLEPKGVDLKNILTDEGPRAFDNILKCFLGITACQVLHALPKIALTNVLVALGLAPDCIVGHSVGELGCAYVDGCMTEEETILSSWARGQACNDSGLVRGMMAAIGLGHKDVISRVPANIDIACHNSPTSCTLSGLPADVTEFTNELIAEGVFAKAVSVSGIALHSRYIQPAAPLLRKYLQEVAPNPRPRSPKWIPTGVPPDERECDLAKTPSAEYQTNNLLYPVFFEEALPDIPSDAIVIELAPHGLLQPLLRRSLPGRVNAPLTLRNNTNPVRFLLNAIGKISLYTSVPNVAALYPDVAFPVPRGTASVAALVHWPAETNPYNYVFDKISIRPPEQELDVHYDSPSVKVNGIRLFPLSEQLVPVWLDVAVKESRPIGAFPVTFVDVKVRDWVAIPAKGKISLRTSLMPGTAEAIVLADDRLVTQVQAFANDEPPHQLHALDPASWHATTRSKEQVYSDLCSRGMDYSSKYQNIQSIRRGGRDWIISTIFNGRWSNLLETIMQIYIVKEMSESNTLRLPEYIQHVFVDPSKLIKGTEVVLRLNLASGVLSGDGVHVSGFSAKPCPPQRCGLVTSRHRVLTTTAETYVARVNGVDLEFVSIAGASGGGSAATVGYVGALNDGRVMGVGRWPEGRRQPELDPLLRWPLPEEWSVAEAVAVPYAYSLVYYFLQVKVKVRAGSSILVHEGSSAIGQAAIRVAAQLGCDPIFTTVGSGRQRALVTELFPQMEPRYVLSHEDGVSFELAVRRMTRGRGVHLVLNTLGQSKLKATLRCLRLSGTVLQLNREGGVDCDGILGYERCTILRKIESEDILNFVIPKYHNPNSPAVHNLSGSVLLQANEMDRQRVAEAVTRGLNNKIVQPLHGNEVGNAMARFMDKEDPMEPAAVARDLGEQSPVARLHRLREEVRLESLLPQTHAALSEVGRGVTVEPSVLELRSLGPRARRPRENQPVFVLPPLGVLDAASRAELAGLAAKLLNSILVVETTVQGGIRDTASAVVATMTSHQPHGPYNVLGVGVSTVLALEVHRQLEAAGRRGVLFLVHGDVGTVARWAGTVRPFGGASAAPDREAQRGAETVAQLLEAVHAHDSDVGRPFEGSVHVVRTSVDDHQSLDENDPHVEVWTYNEHCLDNSVFARFINANIAYSQVAGQQDLRISIKKAPLL